MQTFKTPRVITASLLATLIAFTLACGYSSKAAAPPVAGNVPAIASLSPSAANAGDPAFTLTVNGSLFSGKAVVNWNGAAQTASTTFVSANQLTVAVPASAVATAGSVSITVTNPGTPGTGPYGGGGTLPETSTAMSFTIN
jgi:hypothetical protein